MLANNHSDANGRIHNNMTNIEDSERQLRDVLNKKPKFGVTNKQYYARKMQTRQCKCKNTV